MACTYKFNGLTFKSELDLDDYLMRNKELLEKHPDIVFNLEETSRLLQAVISKIDLNTHDRVVPARDKMRRFRDEYDDWDIESHKIDPPYLGVNDFLKGLKNPNNPGKRLFPEFLKDEYWKRKKEKWTDSAYWSTPEGLKEASDVFEPDINGNFNTHVLTDAEFEAAKDKIEAKWKAQGKIGDEIHNVLAAYWRSTNKGITKDKIYSILTDSKNTKTEDNPNGIDRNYMPNEMVKVILDYCTSLHDELKSKFGDDIVVRPELNIMGDSYDSDGAHHDLMGIVDLLVIDRSGGVHIIDYKTSPKEYQDYNDAKKLAFQYQLATYRKIMEQMGIYFNYNSRMYIVPIQIKELHEIDGNWKYTGLTPYENNFDKSSKTHLVDITNNIMFDTPKHNLFATINRNLDALVPAPEIKDLTGDEILLEVHDEVKKLFPTFEGDRDLTNEEIDKLIKRKGFNTRSTKDNKYHYEFAHKELIANSYPELVDAVKKEFKLLKVNRLDRVLGIKRTLKAAIDLHEGSPEFSGYRRGNAQWLNNKLWKYCNGNWKILDDMSIEALGIIMLENQVTRQVDYIKISTSNVLETKPYYKYADANGTPKKGLKARILLTGYFTPDITLVNKPNSLMAESTIGNIELMETALVINKQAERLRRSDRIVGNVQVINPFALESSMMNNKLLAYCFKELTRLGGIKNNLGTEEGVLLASAAMLARNKLEEIYNYCSSTQVRWNAELMRSKGLASKEWRKYAKRYNDLTSNMRNTEELRIQLLELAKFLQTQMTTTSDGRLSDNFTESYNEELDPARYVYEEVMLALGEIGGLLFKLQLSDHARYLSDPAIWKGWSGNETDNPGNLSSETLNAITSLVTVAYQNIRSEVDAEEAKIHQLVQALKDEKGFGYFKERTYGNQASLYSNMTYIDENGNWKFKDPATDPTLTKAEKDFLHYAIAKINQHRYEKDGDDAFDLHLDTWFDVPLAKGGSDSMASTAGFLNTVKHSLQGLKPKEAAKRAREIAEGIFDPNNEDNVRHEEADLWNMVNAFAAGESPIRLNLLSSREKGYWEHNLETLLLKHTYAYSLEEHMSEVLPLIKSTLIHLGQQGVIVNTKFEKDIDYLRKYVNNKIHNRSLIDPKDRPIMEAALKGMRWASISALAFSPLQLYQVLDGIWKDISLMIRKPDGNTSFTFQNMKDAFFYVYKDAVHYGNKKSLCERLNQFYGINDMDMNSYADKIKSDLSGFWNFTSLAFRFASRPDFYNRLTIFGALMRGDGCWDAHSIDKDGNLVYDIKKDKRFEAFVNGWQNDPRYNQLKGLFIQMALQMEREHTRDRFGNLYRMNLTHPDLPKAYTTQQSESMKALGDLTYGYYAHEKKSLFNSSAIGTLFMLMITYWSSKKNQWLAPGGIKSQGYYKQYEEPKIGENGEIVREPDGSPVMEKYWYEVDENGNISDIPTANPANPAKAIPYMVWQGLFQEGIIVTMSKIINDLIHGDPAGKDNRWLFIKSEYWNNEDESVRRAYRQNLNLLWNDLLMFILLGLIIGPSMQQAAKEHAKERGNEDLPNAFANMSEQWAAAIVNSSGSDFNMLSSVFGKTFNWTPFAMESITRTASSLSEVISGDMRFYDAIVKSTAVGRTARPIFEYLNPKEI